MTRAALSLVALLLLAACGPDRATFTPAPRSTESALRIEQDAEAWRLRDPENRFWSYVAATGSMEPVINEHSIVECLRYRGQSLPNGSVVIFNRGDVPRVIHVVADQNATHFYLSGYANHNSDGWYPKTAVEGFVVGQLYLP